MRFLKLILFGAVFLPALALAQVQVLGFEIGSSTARQVKAAVGRHAKVRDAGTNKYTGGPQFKTDGSGYDIDSLSEVFYIFDKDEKLAGVLMTMSKSRFDEIVEVLASKHKLTQKMRPFVGDMSAAFSAKGVRIEIDAPHLSFDMHLRYIRDDLYRQFRTQSAQEEQEKKRTEQTKF